MVLTKNTRQIIIRIRKINTDCNLPWRETEMKENYVYPATMKKVDEMYQVEFLDFPDASLVEADTK